MNLEKKSTECGLDKTGTVAKLSILSVYVATFVFTFYKKNKW